MIDLWVNSIVENGQQLKKKHLSFLKKKATCLHVVRAFIKLIAMTMRTVEIIYIEKNFRIQLFYKWIEINA